MMNGTASAAPASIRKIGRGPPRGERVAKGGEKINRLFPPARADPQDLLTTSQRQGFPIRLVCIPKVAR